MHQFASGRPDTDDINQLKTFAKEVKAKIDASRLTEVQVKGNRPYKELKESVHFILQHLIHAPCAAYVQNYVRYMQFPLKRQIKQMGNNVFHVCGVFKFAQVKQDILMNKC